MLLVLDLLWRGYRVVLTTHSPQLLTAVWMLGQLQKLKASPQRLLEGFGVKASASMKQLAEAALQKSYRTHLFELGGDAKVRSVDISSLDPGAEDERVAGWGGLTGFSSRLGEAVRIAVNESAG